MRVVVAGLGVQGHKRRRFAGADFVTEVDPRNTEAKHRGIEEVPVGSYDAALLCVPDEAKLALLDYLIANRKHALVEKPLVGSDPDLARIEAAARSAGVLVYTAYNHRFEPHFVRMRDAVRSGELGRVYHCRMFYGNGTARLVRDSEWRDTGAGVLPDLGSHLLDTLRFWFEGWDGAPQLVAAERFENRAPDHVVITARGAAPAVDLEMTLLNWRNHFYCDVLAEKGSAHIRSLCKWGPSEFILRRRVLPSGRPPEESVTLVQDDPTWQIEYDWFKRACAEGRQTDLSTDRYIGRELARLESQIPQGRQ
jgi:scyllo-inositol 2-dehydrogenase (NADP+)